MEATHDIQWAGGERSKGRCEHCGQRSDLLWRYEVGPRRRKRKVQESPCSRCAYCADINGWVLVCQYILIHEACRPCPSGRYCTVREVDPKLAHKVQAQARAQTQSRPRPPKWDFDLASEMYRQGRSLEEISQAVGAARETVRIYMRNRGMTFESVRDKNWDKARAVELRRHGATYKEIAEAVGISKSVLYKYLQVRGVEPVIENAPGAEAGSEGKGSYPNEKGEDCNQHLL